MKFPCVIMAARGNEAPMDLGTVEAENKDEALGKALRICRERYTTQNGYCQHYAEVCDPDKVI